MKSNRPDTAHTDVGKGAEFTLEDDVYEEITVTADDLEERRQLMK